MFAALQLFNTITLLVAIATFTGTMRVQFRTINHQINVNENILNRLLALERNQALTPTVLMLACPRVADVDKPAEECSVARCRRCSEPMWLHPQDRTRLDTTPMMVALCTPCVMAASAGLDHAKAGS